MQNEEFVEVMCTMECCIQMDDSAIAYVVLAWPDGTRRVVGVLLPEFKSHRGGTSPAAAIYRKNK